MQLDILNENGYHYHNMSPEQAFIEYLDKNGLRLTGQRRLILDVFLKKEGHFTSEELYALVSEHDNTIGQATVYRNIKHLTSAGLARQCDFGDGPVYYEHKYGHEHHDHILCTVCGKRTEVYSEKIERLQRRLSEEHGYTLQGHKLYLYGICGGCGSK